MWGYVIHHLHRRGLGKRVGVFDAETFSLASASTSLPNDLLLDDMLLFSDEQATFTAVDYITLGNGAPSST